MDGGSNGSEDADSSNNLNEGENNDAPTITSKEGDNVIAFSQAMASSKAGCILSIQLLLMESAFVCCMRMEIE